MSALQKLASLSGATLLAVALGASAATPPKADEHAGHHPQAAASAPKPAAVDERMKAMGDMRDKMASAKTPAERQALMADHMKAMQDGMQMMKGMSGMSDMGGGMGAKAGTKAGAKGMPSDMSKHHQMMEEHMDMMQTMMEMMMQRMSAAEAAGK